MNFRIMTKQGANLWSFHTEDGFLWEAETRLECAEKFRELAEEMPLGSLAAVKVLEPDVLIELECECPEPTPEEPEEPDNPENPDDPNEPGEGGDNEGEDSGDIPEGGGGDSGGNTPPGEAGDNTNNGEGNGEGSGGETEGSEPTTE